MDGDPGLRRPRHDPAAPSVQQSLILAALDLDGIFANMPKWQIEHEILARPQGPSQSGMLLLDEIGLASNRIGGAVRATGYTPQGQLAIGLDIATPAGRQFGGRPLGPDDALIGYSGAELDYLHPPGFDDLSMILPGTLLEEAVAIRLGREATLAPFGQARIGRAGRTARPDLWRLFRWLAHLLHGEAELPAEAAAQRLLRAEVLDAAGTLVARFLEDGTDPDEPTWHHRRPVVLRAREFMRANLHEPVTLAQLCAAARASERTVEYGFRELYGVGAKRYLKLLRLNHVRRRLATTEPASIQEIAQDSGFWHMGHFAADYRGLFGETPTETLRRRSAGSGIQRAGAGSSLSRAKSR